VKLGKRLAGLERKARKSRVAKHKIDDLKGGENTPVVGKLSTLLYRGKRTRKEGRERGRGSLRTDIKKPP